MFIPEDMYKLQKIYIETTNNPLNMNMHDF